MKTTSGLYLILASVALLPGVAAAQSTPSGKGEHQAVRTVADKDFGRLSDDGISAFNDIHHAGLDIFDGNVDQAGKLVDDALDSLRKAKSDGSVFMKAESDLHGPSSPAAKSPLAGPGTKLAWLPIDAEIVMGETYKPTPKGAAAMVDANRSLERGEGDKALDRIRLAALDVDYMLTLAPLDQSTSDVEKAGRLMAAHDYYGASQALRDAESNVRYDETDDIAHVRQGGGKAAGK